MIVVRGLHNLKTFSDSDKVCLSMGNFDGLHLGHQRVLKEMMLRVSDFGGKGIVLTFNPHPRWLLDPKRPPLLLTTLREQIELFSQWNLDMLIVTRFDRNFASLSPEEFVNNILIEKLSIQELFIGEDFCFGRNKSGTISLLKTMGEMKGFCVHQIPLLRYDSEIISSTVIRKKIQTGEIETANQLLGHEYSITGKVIRGSGRGAYLGYPTANLKVRTKILPPLGVYIVKVNNGGNSYFGLANIGYKPTFKGQKEIGLEVYILNFTENIYNQRISIFFQKRIREEITFSNPQALKEQIKQDVEQISQWIGIRASK